MGFHYIYKYDLLLLYTVLDYVMQIVIRISLFYHLNFHACGCIHVGHFRRTCHKTVYMLLKRVRSCTVGTQYCYKCHTNLSLLYSHILFSAHDSISLKLI